MLLAASFREHYSRATTGNIGDGNVDHFNAAMNPETDRREAAKAFNNADGSFFYAQNGRLKIIHGLTDLGNSFIRRESKVGGQGRLREQARRGPPDVDPRVQNVPTLVDHREVLQGLQERREPRKQL